MRFSLFASLLAVVSAQTDATVDPSVAPVPTTTLGPLPVATATTTYTFRGPSGVPLICAGSVISAAPAGSTESPSPILIDSNGILTCNGLTGFLRQQPGSGNNGQPTYDVILSTPPPAAGDVPGYFAVSNTGSLSASTIRSMRRKRQNAPLNANINNGVLVVGGNAPPGVITGTVIIAAPGSSTVPGTVAPTGSVSGTVTGSQGAGSNTLTSAPTATGTGGVSPGFTTTQTATVTVTAPGGAVQTLVAVQVIINGLPVGSVTVFVNINGVLVQVTVTGLSVAGNIITIGAGFTISPVIVSVIVIVTPVIYVSAGVTISGVTTVTGFVTAIGGGGAGAVTIINSVNPVTITRTQTIVVPAGTIVPVANGPAVIAVVVTPGSVPVIAAAAAARSNTSSILPPSRGSAAKFGMSGLVAGVVAVGVAALL